MADPTTRAGERFTAEQLRKRASAIYIAVEESVADDISACLRQAAEDAEVLERLGRLRMHSRLVGEIVELQPFIDAERKDIRRG